MVLDKEALCDYELKRRDYFIDDEGFICFGNERAYAYYIDKQHRPPEVFTETFEGNDEFSLGRSFIRKFKVLLDGPGNRVCLRGPSVMGKEDPTS